MFENLTEKLGNVFSSLKKRGALTEKHVDEALKEVQSLNQNIVTSCFDLNDTNQLTEFISKSDLVLIAVPGNLGFKTVQRIIKCKKNIVDISFASENLMLLKIIIY